MGISYTFNPFTNNLDAISTETGFLLADGTVDLTGSLLVSGTTRLNFGGAQHSIYSDSSSGLTINAGSLINLQSTDGTVLRLEGVASSANFVNIINQAPSNGTDGAPIISTDGSDGDVSLHIGGKGTGEVVIDGRSFHGDNIESFYGDGAAGLRDSKIVYDGTDLIIDPRRTGTGKLNINFSGTSEVVMEPDTMTFNNGATDTDINWATDGRFRIRVGAVSQLIVDAAGLEIGRGQAGIDYALVFNGGANDGKFAWDEGNDRFQYDDDLLMQSTEKIFFGDTGTFIHQSSDGNLLVEADTKLTLGVAGDTELGDSTLRVVKPQTTLKIGLGGASNVFSSLWVQDLNLLERSTDPTEPSEGYGVIWMSDGTEKGDDGDIMIASQAGGSSMFTTLFDHSAGSTW